jgi:hypothetical protein
MQLWERGDFAQSSTALQRFMQVRRKAAEAKSDFRDLFRGFFPAAKK